MACGRGFETNYSLSANAGSQKAQIPGSPWDTFMKRISMGAILLR